MKTIKTSEIEQLYKKCDIDVMGSGKIRTTLNLGTLNNKLNNGMIFQKDNTVNSVLSNDIILKKK